MSDRLFDVDEIPEVPLFRAPHGRKASGLGDARFLNDYPPDWDKCQRCGGVGRIMVGGDCTNLRKCRVCLGMGSLKARVRLEAGHRCARCKHPYIPKSDAAKLGVEASYYRFSPCDAECVHQGPLFERFTDDDSLLYQWEPMPDDFPQRTAGQHYARGRQPYAEWRILTVHHLDGDKANCAWWNLAALCQRCHLKIQAKVILDRVYPYEHTPWFKPYVAGYYAHVYLGQNLTRPEVEARLDELLNLERGAPA